MFRSLRGASGQATVELALTLPLVAILLGVIVEVGGIALDQVRLWHAARAAVRIAAVDRVPERSREAARGVGLEDLAIEIAPAVAQRHQGDPATVTLRYHPRGRIPVLGSLFHGIELRATASMRIEDP